MKNESQMCFRLGILLFGVGLGLVLSSFVDHDRIVIVGAPIMATAGILLKRPFSGIPKDRDKSDKPGTDY